VETTDFERELVAAQDELTRIAYRLTEDKEKANNLVEKLNEYHKQPFMMHTSGFKYHEIADKLNIPISTIKSRIFLRRHILE
jgi:DNA-directed RNA polymerase specialized sigma24 family protein